MTYLLIPLIVLLLLAALTLWLWARYRRQAAGLPSGQVVYVDTGAWQRNEKPLFSNTYQLTGKPDYLVRERSQIIPVEVKSRAAPDEPYLSHVMQLAAYCLLVEDVIGSPAPFGYIHYRDRTYKVDFTRALRGELLQLLKEMRKAGRAKQVHRSHANARRCAHCGFQTVCGEMLQ